MKKIFLLIFGAISSFTILAQQDGQGLSLKIPGTNTPASYNYSENLYVSGNIGIGTDMYNGYSFGLFNFIMAENNLRILFDDSNESGDGYPFNDWQLEFNSNLPYQSGGTDFFAINDITNSTTPFKIEAGAPDYSLYIKSDYYDYGFAGLCSNVPGKHLQIHQDVSPRFRLEQVGGASPDHTWELGMLNSNLIIRDVTNSSVIPVKIGASNADISSIIKTNENGNIGIQGDPNDAYKFLVGGDIYVDSYMYVEDDDTEGKFRISNINGTLTFEILDNSVWVKVLELD
jgi:hypothetical protein